MRSNRPPVWFMLVLLLVGLGMVGLGIRAYNTEAVALREVRVFLIAAGLIFAIFPFIMALSGTKPSRLTERMTPQERGIGVLAGIVAMLMGGLLYYQLAGGMDSWSPVAFFRTAGLLGVVPVLFFGFGAYVVVASVLNVRQSPATVRRVRRFFLSIAATAGGESGDEGKRAGLFDVVSALCYLIPSLALLAFSVWIPVMAADNVTRIASLPFFLCMLMITGRILANLAGLASEVGIARELDRSRLRMENGGRTRFLAEKLRDTHARRERRDDLFSKAYVWSICLFYFGFLLFVDVVLMMRILRGDGELSFFLLTFVFWAAGLYAAHTRFRR